MDNNKKGVSLIALIITIAVLVIIATVTIQNGAKRTDEARIAKHNTNITTTQEEVENYYYYKGGKLPVADLTPYPLPAGSSLLAETVKNNEDTDKFYRLYLSKLGKVAGNDDNYIVSATRHTVYYVDGTTIKGITYHGLIRENDIKLEQIPAYNSPIVPTSFTHVGNETWDNGFTIQDANGNQFVWVPALAPVVQANGTLDGTNFNSKFGRRRFMWETFDVSNFYEANDIMLQNMTASVDKYGGFYIAKYETSNNGGKAQSKADVAPWVNIDWNAARLEAETMDTKNGWNTNVVESYLCYGVHWDTTLEWIIDSGAKNLSQVATDSSSWGNYTNDTFSGTAGIGNTGQWSQTNVKGVYDLGGNIWEWTMEGYNSSKHVCRGGGGYDSGVNRPSAYRFEAPVTYYIEDVSYRCVLYIK